MAHTPSSHPLLAPLLTHLDRTLLRLSALLRTTSGLDLTLQTLAYTLTLLHSQLRILLNKRLSALASSIALNAQKVLLPGESLLLGLEAPRSLKVLAQAEDGTRRLSELISDVRIFMRLLGLVGIYGWGRGHYKASQEEKGDWVMRRIVWAQILANAGFQFLENGAYLAQHEVLKWSAEKQSRWWLWSSRLWTMHVLLEFGRLWRVGELRAKERRERVGEKEEKMAWREEDREWWREMIVNAAWAPLVLHWSLEGGLVSDGVVGMCGSLAGLIGLRDVWRKTAKMR